MNIIALDAKPPKQAPVGRECVVCGLRLSRYNHGTRCSIHAPEPDWVYLGIEFVLCQTCGTPVNAGKRTRKTQQCDDCRRGR